MKLTRTERWIISNQLRILQELVPSKPMKGVPMDFSKSDLQNARDAIEQGFELEYDGLCEHVYADTMSEERCTFVLDVLEMFEELKIGFDFLEDKSGIDSADVTFHGWWANNEGRELAYARHFCEGRERFVRLGKSAWADSHYPTLDRYLAMLTAYKALDKHGLEKEDIMLIVAAGRRAM